MKDTVQEKILATLYLVLRQIAKALLNSGIGYREYAEISKTAFVDIATKNYGLRGRPTNISRVAVMTGLTRKEVRRIRDKANAGEETTIERNTPMSEILHRWFTDKEFVDSSGQPLILDFFGDTNSFSALVRKHGGDIPPGAMRTELKRINAIEDIGNGRLRVLKRNVSGLALPDRLVTGLAKVVYPAVLALAHNTSPNCDDTWVHRTAATRYVRKEDIGRLRRISSDRLSELTESIDDLFVAYETLYEKDPAYESVRAVGIGVFYFEEDKAESDIFS